MSDADMRLCLMWWDSMSRDSVRLSPSYRNLHTLVYNTIPLWREIFTLVDYYGNAGKGWLDWGRFPAILLDEHLIHWYYLADTHFFGWWWRYQIWYLWTSETRRNVKNQLPGLLKPGGWYQIGIRCWRLRTPLNQVLINSNAEFTVRLSLPYFLE